MLVQVTHIRFLGVQLKALFYPVPLASREEGVWNENKSRIAFESIGPPLAHRFKSHPLGITLSDRGHIQRKPDHYVVLDVWELRVLFACLCLQVLELKVCATSGLRNELLFQSFSKDGKFLGHAGLRAPSQVRL